MWARAFRTAYVAGGGSRASADSYVSYLRRIERLGGGLEARMAALGGADLIEWAERLPPSVLGGIKNTRDSLSALRKFVQLIATGEPPASLPCQDQGGSIATPGEIVELLREAKALAVRYYRATGKPLGVTGEVAELEAAEKLGLRLERARTAGFDAWDPRHGTASRIQIKGRAVDPADPYRGRCPAIRCGGCFDRVVLVLLDRTTLDLIEMWEAREEAIAARLAAPGSKARNDRGSLGIAQFRSVARRCWPIGEAKVCLAS